MPPSRRRHRSPPATPSPSNGLPRPRNLLHRPSPAIHLSQTRGAARANHPLPGARRRARADHLLPAARRRARADHLLPAAPHRGAPQRILRVGDAIACRRAGVRLPAGSPSTRATCHRQVGLRRKRQISRVGRKGRPAIGLFSPEHRGTLRAIDSPSSQPDASERHRSAGVMPWSEGLVVRLRRLASSRMVGWKGRFQERRGVETLEPSENPGVFRGRRLRRFGARCLPRMDGLHRWRPAHLAEADVFHLLPALALAFEGRRFPWADGKRVPWADGKRLPRAGGRRFPGWWQTPSTGWWQTFSTVRPNS
jgi:hypothetical protein